MEAIEERGNDFNAMERSQEPDLVEISESPDPEMDQEMNQEVDQEVNPEPEPNIVEIIESSETDISSPSYMDLAREHLSSCASCQCKMVEPTKLLNCCHVVCDECSADLIVECKACKTSTNTKDLVANPFSSEKTKSVEKPLLCSFCDEADVLITKFCTQCCGWVCDACLQSHRRMKMFKLHTLLSSEELQNQATLTTSVGRQSVMCSKHPKEFLEWFCIDCDVPTCRDCQLVFHAGHNYQSIQDVAAKSRQNTNELIVKATAKQDKVSGEITDIVDRLQERDSMMEAINYNIDDFFSRCMESISTWREKLKIGFMQCLKPDIEKLKVIKSELEQINTTFNFALTFAKYSVADTVPLPAMMSLQKIVDRNLEMLMSRTWSASEPTQVFKFVHRNLKLVENAMMKSGYIVKLGNNATENQILLIAGSADDTLASECTPCPACLTLNVNNLECEHCDNVIPSNVIQFESSENRGNKRTKNDDGAKRRIDLKKHNAEKYLDGDATLKNGTRLADEHVVQQDDNDDALSDRTIEFVNDLPEDQSYEENISIHGTDNKNGAEKSPKSAGNHQLNKMVINKTAKVVLRKCRVGKRRSFATSQDCKRNRLLIMVSSDDDSDKEVDVRSSKIRSNDSICKAKTRPSVSPKSSQSSLKKDRRSKKHSF